MKKTRRKFSPAFKFKVVVEALKERQSLSELAEKFEVHQNVISAWKKDFLEKGPDVFKQPNSKDDSEKEKEELYKQIGKMKIENEWLKKKLF